MKTEIEVLIDQLDNRFGNEKAPKQYQCIQEAVSALRSLNDQCKAYEKYIGETELRKLQ